MKNRKLIPLKEVLRTHFTKEEREEIERKTQRRLAIRTLRDLREEKGLTQLEISNVSGIPRSTISKIENGSRNVSLKKLLQIANSVGTDLEIRFVPREK